MGEENVLTKVQYLGEMGNIKKTDEFIKRLPLCVNGKGCTVDARSPIPEDGSGTLHIYPFGVYETAEITLLGNDRPGKYNIQYESNIFKKEEVKKKDTGNIGFEIVPYTYFRVDCSVEQPLFKRIGIRLRDSLDLQIL